MEEIEAARTTGASSAGPVRADARRNRARILEAAGAVFAEHGATASTEVVAARAGVAVGTVFRHFPTKPDLLQAVVMDVLDQLVADVEDLVEDPHPATDLSTFCTRVVELSAHNRALFERLAETGTRVHVADALARLRPTVDLLLRRAQDAGVVRTDLRSSEFTALLAAVGQAAVADGWDGPFRQRVLTILLDGLRPSSAP